MKIVFNKIYFITILLLSLLPTTTTGKQVVLDSLLFGVTIDNPWNSSAVSTALGSHSVRPTARIVFDEYESDVSATDYSKTD